MKISNIVALLAFASAGFLTFAIGVIGSPLSNSSVTILYLISLVIAWGGGFLIHYVNKIEQSDSAQMIVVASALLSIFLSWFIAGAGFFGSVT